MACVWSEELGAHRQLPMLKTFHQAEGLLLQYSERLIELAGRRIGNVNLSIWGCVRTH